jgi:hypothetical protein
MQGRDHDQNRRSVGWKSTKPTKHEAQVRHLRDYEVLCFAGQAAARALDDGLEAQIGKNSRSN